MTEEEKKIARAAELDDAIKAADKKRADAEAEEGKALDNKLSDVLNAVTSCVDRLDAIGKRMDALEAGEKGKEEAKANPADLAKRIAALTKLTAKKDDDEGDDDFDDLPETTREGLIAEEMKNFSDREPGEARRLAADSARTRYDDEIKRESVDDHDRRRQNLRVDAQAMADNVYNSLGMQCPPPMFGETPRNYRRRLLRGIQRHSPDYKNIDLDKVADAKLFALAEKTIIADALREGARPTEFQPGRLRMKERKRDGHIVREFIGQPRDWMDQFAGQTGLKVTGQWLHNLGRS
jgi:colicin import membrane protein